MSQSRTVTGSDTDFPTVRGTTVAGQVTCPSSSTCPRKGAVLTQHGKVTWKRNLSCLGRHSDRHVSVAATQSPGCLNCFLRKGLFAVRVPCVWSSETGFASRLDGGSCCCQDVKTEEAIAASSFLPTAPDLVSVESVTKAGPATAVVAKAEFSLNRSPGSRLGLINTSWASQQKAIYSSTKPSTLCFFPLCRWVRGYLGIKSLSQ